MSAFWVRTSVSLLLRSAFLILCSYVILIHAWRPFLWQSFHFFLVLALQDDVSILNSALALSGWVIFQSTKATVNEHNISLGTPEKIGTFGVHRFGTGLVS